MSWDLSSEEVICNKLESQQTVIFAFSKKIKELEAKNVELETRLQVAEGEWKTYATVSKSLSKKLQVAVDVLDFYAKTESWEADGWIANADLHEPWGDQGISLGGKCAIEALENIKGIK